jgi:hypothetical protein
MPTIGNACEFVDSSSKMYLQTNLNGDTLTIAGVHLSQENAAILAWLLNSDQDLQVKIKVNS